MGPSGAPVKQLEGFIEKKDRAGIFHAAHSFRPQLEFVGLKNMAALVLQMEQGAKEGLGFGELTNLLEQVICCQVAWQEAVVTALQHRIVLEE